MRKREGVGCTDDHKLDKPGKEAKVGGEEASHSDSARGLTTIFESICEKAQLTICECILEGMVLRIRQDTQSYASGVKRREV
jgi:hypothetical protein